MKTISAITGIYYHLHIKKFKRSVTEASIGAEFSRATSNRHSSTGAHNTDVLHWLPIRQRIIAGVSLHTSARPCLSDGPRCAIRSRQIAAFR